MRSLIAGLVAAAAAPFAAAAAEVNVQWSYAVRDGRPYLQGFSGIVEEDNEFWARCIRPGTVQVGVGAFTGVGEGKGEAVSVKLSSGDRSAEIMGVSRNSPNFQMTAASELRAEIPIGHPVFAVFETGKPISVAGSVANPVVWGVRGLRARSASFVKACKG
jgi:hypothetical protein